MSANIVYAILVTSLATFLSRFLGAVSSEGIKEASKLGFDNIILPSKQKVIIDKNMNYNNLTLLSDLVDLITKNI